MILTGTLLYGISHAIRMYKRREHLKALERILVCLESEIRYRHSVIGEAFLNVAEKTEKPFRTWLYYLGERLNSNSMNQDNIYRNRLNEVDIYNNNLNEVFPMLLKMKSVIMRVFLAYGQTLFFCYHQVPVLQRKI